MIKHVCSLDVTEAHARNLQEAWSKLRAFFRPNERLFVNISARDFLTNFCNKTQSERVLINAFSTGSREEWYLWYNAGKRVTSERREISKLFPAHERDDTEMLLFEDQRRRTQKSPQVKIYQNLNLWDFRVRRGSKIGRSVSSRKFDRRESSRSRIKRCPEGTREESDCVGSRLR